MNQKEVLLKTAIQKSISWHNIRSETTSREQRRVSCRAVMKRAATEFPFRSLKHGGLHKGEAENGSEAEDSHCRRIAKVCDYFLFLSHWRGPSRLWTCVCVRDERPSAWYLGLHQVQSIRSLRITVTTECITLTHTHTHTHTQPQSVSTHIDIYIH